MNKNREHVDGCHARRRRTLISCAGGEVQQDGGQYGLFGSVVQTVDNKGDTVVE